MMDDGDLMEEIPPEPLEMDRLPRPVKD